MRLKNQQVARLSRLARQLGRTTSETCALLVEEALRRSEFGHIDFRNTVVGRQAYVQGSSLAVWEVLMVAQSYRMDIRKTAAHLHCPEFRVQAALNYAAAFPVEINDAMDENNAYDFQRLSRSLPQTELFVAEAKENYSTGNIGKPGRGTKTSSSRTQRKRT